MAAPVVTLSTTQEHVSVGEGMEVVVSWTDLDDRDVIVTATVTDQQQESGSATLTIHIHDNGDTSTEVTDSEGRIWTKVSGTANSATYTATA